jgi:transglutaminase-like putative cysteine protease
MNHSKLSITVAKIVLAGLSLYFLYVLGQAVSTVNRRHISTKVGIYINSTTTTTAVKELAKILTKNCKTTQCSTQNILDYITNIPYKINNFQAHSPQDTIQKNFGDCDDKSNLLISLLHEKGIESYFVLVPHHIFVISHLNKELHREGLYLDGKKYYILESTAKNSVVGFPLQYELNQIDAIIEPFENRKIEINKLEWKL